MNRAVVMMLVLGIAASACGSGRITYEDQLRAALRETTVSPRSYTYEDRLADGTTSTVHVTVEDDFRYAATWIEDGNEVFSEVVRDDALAVRALDQALVLDRLGVGAPEPEEVQEVLASAEADPELAARIAEAAGAAGLSSVSDPVVPPQVQGIGALRTGGWVIDEIGAPPLTLPAGLDVLGEDPVNDAVGVLNLVRDNLSSTPMVRRWDDSAIEYRADEDPFRAPADDPEQEEVRYDLDPVPTLGRVQVTDASAAASFTPAMLRQMAVYVRDGHVTEVRLRIDATAVYEEIEKAYGLSPDGAPAERAARALDAVNVARSALGQEPIVARDVTVTFDEVGEPQRVDLPTGTVASVAFLVNRGSEEGRIPEEPEPTGDPVPAPVVADEP